MICPNCKEEFDLCMETVIMEEAAHDEALIDLIIECPECLTRYNTFFKLEDMVML